MATISQRISLEGSDDIRRKLEELGKAGEKAFKQIQDAAKQPISDPAAIDRTKQAFDQLAAAVAKLSPQFKVLVGDAQQFGTAGAKAGQDTAVGMDKAGDAVVKTGAGFKGATTEAKNLAIQTGIVAGVVAAATTKLLGLADQIRQALSPEALLKGAVETGKALADMADKLGLSIGEWQKLSQAIAVAGVSQEDFVQGISKLAKTIADAKGGFVQLIPGQFISTSKGAVAVMRDLAAWVSKLGDSAQAAALGTKLFGDNWKNVIKVLLGTKPAADAADDVFDKLAKVDRALSPDQAEKAAKLAKGWEILGKAIRAFKDQVGTVFIDSALLRAEWMIKLVDGSRELFKSWQQLAGAKKAAFLEGLGDSPTELLFKTLLETSELLAKLWDSVLVPAGEKLFEMFKGIGQSLKGLPAANVIAFFLTATIAALGLAAALKGLQFLLAPLVALFSLAFSPLGVVLLAVAAAAAVFWDKLSAGAKTVAALIPAELAAIGESFKKLFTGDFTGFWTQFSEAAVSAFEKIKAAAEKTELGALLIKGLEAFVRDLPGTIEKIGTAFIGLGVILDKVGDQLSKVFGTKITGTDVAAFLVLGQMTGGLQALGSAATIAAAAMTSFGVAFGIVATVIGGPWAAGILSVAAAIGTLMFWLTQTESGQAFAKMILELHRAMNLLIDDFAKEIKVSFWKTIESDIKDLTTVVNGLIAAYERLISIAQGAPAALRGIAAGGGEPGSVTPAPGNASGGYISGPGTATSDSILARLSNGEFVLSARAVNHWGVDFLRALNSLHMPGFSMGGLVPSMPSMPRFADGGLVGPQHLGTVDLRTDHGSVSLMAAPSAVEQLQRLAVTRRMTSTGRKPGFIG